MVWVSVGCGVGVGCGVLFVHAVRVISAVVVRVRGVLFFIGVVLVFVDEGGGHFCVVLDVFICEFVVALCRCDEHGGECGVWFGAESVEFVL